MAIRMFLSITLGLDVSKKYFSIAPIFEVKYIASVLYNFKLCFPKLSIK